MSHPKGSLSRTTDAAPQPQNLSTEHAEPVPSHLGRYRVLARLGAGGFGVVYRGFDDELHRSVAIKVPHRHRLHSPDQAEAYLAEGRSLARLDHPGIVPVYDVGRTPDGLCYLVSRFVEGSDLAAALARQRPALADAVTLVVQVAEALHHAHQQGVIHRDVKPANILLDARGRPIVADFGLALREEDFGKGPTFAGTPAYMSPEQARGEGHRVDARTDVYSLGVVFYQLLTGRQPFQGDSVGAVLDQVIGVEPRPPRQLDGRVPRELDRICLKALAKRAADRYSTALDLVEDLRHWLGDTAATIVAPPTARVVPRGLRSFEGQDADFFLELLPGPRDRDGLPASVRFWKDRVEETDPERTFNVGLLYGPSGCGKSSLVKAGLLPRLDGHVVAFLVEASATDTEARLLRGLHKHCPETSGFGSVVDAFAGLRCGLPDGGKVFVVLDQFEQWLHANRGRADTELARALRHCDGRHVQVLLLVRDDFWLSAGRFMHVLEVRLVEGVNVALADLFDVGHARKVLTALGYAYGRLQEPLINEQELFLERAVASLSQEGKVVGVRLALFAEMVKGKPWLPATLDEVGGAEGVGVAFLEETFAARSANPEHRLHQQAARNVLRALLPEESSDIRGRLRSDQELLEVSGYEGRPREFAALLAILDTELRLVTPADPEETRGGQFYQLTHDYLVPALRQWLTRKQRETRRGRAELLLAERTAAWNVRPEVRQLPSWPEWLRILLFTRRREWEDTSTAMMRRATRRHVGRGVLLGLFVLIVLAGGSLLWHGVERQQRQARADALVARLMDVETSEVPRLVEQNEALSPWTEPALRAIRNDVARPAKERLHAALALLPGDHRQSAFLRERLLTARPAELLVIRAALAPNGYDVADELWDVMRGDRSTGDERLRAACCLALFDPLNSRWDGIRHGVVAKLIAEPSLDLGQWIEALRPCGSVLIEPLRAVFVARREADEGLAAASILAEYAADQPEFLVELIRVAEPRQLAPLAAKLKTHEERAVKLLDTLLAETKVPAEVVRQRHTYYDDPENARNEVARLHARAAAVLAGMGRGDRVWPLLRQRPDPRLRTYLIHYFAPAGVDPQLLVDRFRSERDNSIRRALLLSLGEYRKEILSDGASLELVNELATLSLNDPDAGIHSALDWLLSRWGVQSPRDFMRSMPTVPRALQDLWRAQSNTRRWYTNGQDHTLSIVPGPVEVTMGAPWTEWHQPSPDEKQHRRFIDRSFAIATREVTREQFGRFLRDHPSQTARESPEAECPAGFVTWYDAAKYCRWLSEREGVPLDQMCYPPVEQIKPGMKLTPDHLLRTGYRLPSEAEWEYACRAGAVTTCSFGHDFWMLPQYAWFLQTARSRTWPVGKLKPNDLGLFDMHGNAWEWCHDLYYQHRPDPTGQVLADRSGLPEVTDTAPRVQKSGGIVAGAGANLRSAHRRGFAPGVTFGDVGFRVARTVRSPGIVGRVERQAPRQLARFEVQGGGKFRVHVAAGDIDVSPVEGVAPAFVTVSGGSLDHKPFAFAVEHVETGATVTTNGTLTEGFRSHMGRVNSLGMKLALVSPGEFLMGSTAKDIEEYLGTKRPEDEYGRNFIKAEGPQHRVKITRPFYIGTHKVTVGEFARFTAASGYKTTAENGHPPPSECIIDGWWRPPPAGTCWRKPGYAQSQDYPVVCLAFQDALALCKWLTEKEGVEYRLPTEAEWEYACRAGGAERYPWGKEDAEASRHAWWHGNCGSRPQPVGRLRPNAWGLYDMLGNVFEWCSDEYGLGYYKKAPAEDPPGPPSKDGYRVTRGGAFWTPTQPELRSARRWAEHPSSYGNGSGLRLVRAAKEVKPVPFTVQLVDRQEAGCQAEIALLGPATDAGGIPDIPFVVKDVEGGVEVFPRQGKAPTTVRVVAADRRPRPFSFVVERTDTKESVRVAGMLICPEWDLTFYAWDTGKLDPGAVDWWARVAFKKPLDGWKSGAIDFNWGTGAPSPKVPANGFAMTAESAVELPEGVYEFELWSDDGARLYLDGAEILGAPATSAWTRVRLSAGLHRLKVEYFEITDNAAVRLAIRRVSGG